MGDQNRSALRNTDRFTGRAEAYDRYRLRYAPEPILKLLRVWCDLQSDWPIADIGAGTGMLSEIFLANGNPVFAIEPNQEMRSVCEQLAHAHARLEVRDGTAEATGLPDASVSIVAAGRALHWFDGDVGTCRRLSKTSIRARPCMSTTTSNRTERGGIQSDHAR